MGDWRDAHGLDDAIAQWMRDGGERVSVGAGERVDPRVSGTLCLLDDGWLVRSRPLIHARPATLATYLPGDIVMLDVWAGAPTGDELHSLTAATLLCRPVGDFEDALDTDPDLARAVIRRLGQDAGLLREGLAAVGRMDAEERLLVFLYQTHLRLVAGGASGADSRTFDLPMTQGQVGDAIGITSVHVNRVLASLRRQELLSFAGGVVEVHDWPQFQRQALASAPPATPRAGPSRRSKTA